MFNPPSAVIAASTAGSMDEGVDARVEELRAIVMRAGDKWTATGLPRVSMVRAEACSDQVYEPMLHLVLQGTKSLSVGDRILDFAPATYAVVPVDLPAIGQICAGGRGGAYLALSLTLDPAVIGAMLADLCEKNAGVHGVHGVHGAADRSAETGGAGERAAGARSDGIAVAAAQPALIDAWLRMMRLIDRPEEAALLAPMIEREILFRVLQGPHGGMLRQIAHADSRLSQVRRAIDWIRLHYAEPLRVEPLAASCGSNSSCRRALSNRSFFWYWIGVIAVTARKCR
jgi:hypothetical protein